MSLDLKNQSLKSGLENCTIVGNNTKVPWNHPGNVVGWELEELFDKISGGLLIPLLFLLGTPANVLNMMVFYRQGLKERINFCLFFLALVDILHLTPVFLFQVEAIGSWFTNIVRDGKIYHYMVRNNLLGFYGFGYGSMLLAAIISTERCLCVLFPFTAQRCVPTKVFAFVVTVTILTASLLRFIVTAQYRTVCFYEVTIQKKSWQWEIRGDYVSRHQALLSFLEGVFYGVTVSFGCPALVLITTVITAIKLRQIVRWRSQSSSAMSNSKEIAVTKMLICLSLEFLLLSSPLIIVRVTRLFPSVLSVVNHYNLYRVLSYGYNVSFYVSSAVNFLVYYFTGTKYRETLHALLGVKKGADKTVHGKQTPDTQ